MSLKEFYNVSWGKIVPRLDHAVDGLKIEPGDEFSLRAIFRGCEYADRIEIFGDVKAVTYNEMKIESCVCGPWVIQVVVDM